MPGLTLWVNPAVSEREFENQYAAAQQAMIHATDYHCNIVLAKTGFCLGYVSYPEYPIEFFRDEDTSIYLEGMIYNKGSEDCHTELKQIAKKIFSGSVDPKKVLEDWVCQTEGEYVIVMVHPSCKDILVFTDPQGRLPLYYYKNDSNFILSRECKFVENLQNNPKFDRIGCAQFLLFSYPLGKRTLMQDINRVVDGTMFRARLQGNNVQTEFSSLFTFNFDDKDTSGKSTDEFAIDLAEIFTDVCREIGSHPAVSQNVLSLSGGRDSRAIASGMVKAGVPLVASTFQNPDGTTTEDVHLAQELADVLNLSWNLFELVPPQQLEMDELVHMKDGLNYVGMAFIIPFMKHIVEKWGRSALYITGDGGDKALPYLHDLGRISNTDQLVDRILRQHSNMPVGLVESFFDIAPGSLTKELRNVVLSYPEEDFVEKGIHYVVYERGRKWLLEGEDRARFFLWQTSPFYSFKFFKKAMQVPNILKVNYLLYEKFQSLLSSECSEIPFANEVKMAKGGISLRFKLMVYKWICNYLPPSLVELSRQLFGKRRSKIVLSEEQNSLFKSLLKDSGELGKLLSSEGLQKVLATGNYATFNNFWTLVTLVKVKRNNRLV
jgi:asparagine synthase (glutamine-hydrolysing)